MDRLLKTLPLAALIVAFAMLWAWLGFLGALVIIFIAALAFIAVMILAGRD
jgi:hypothetical protein